MAHTRTSDPFAAAGHNTIPRGGYDTDLQSATPARTGSVPGTHATSTPATRVPPPTLGNGSVSGRTGTSGGGGRKTPWYLKTAWIVALIVLLLLALGLGVGLGVGLGTKNNSTNSNGSAAAQDGTGSTVTSYSTYSSIVTGSQSTTIVPIIATNTRSRDASVIIETIGGSTVTAIQPGTQGAGSGVVVTVSETLPPTTRTELVYVTTFPSTQTITTTLPGGVAETVFQTINLRRTVTALATARAKA